MKAFETSQQTIKLDKNIEGRILDIGGGGEGIIGRLYGENVIAIDKRQDELDEAPEGFKKLLMDACDLKFADNEFDAVTSFFTMMYIPQIQHEKVFSEIYRVLKPKGKLHLWDVIIPENQAKYDAFVLFLKIILPEEKISTGYGISYRDQNMITFIETLDKTGFNVHCKKAEKMIFYLTAEK